MAPHEKCRECGSTAGCACSELVTDYRPVAPHETPPPGVPKAVKVEHADRLVYEVPADPTETFLSSDAVDVLTPTHGWCRQMRLEKTPAASSGTMAWCAHGTRWRLRLRRPGDPTGRGES